MQKLTFLNGDTMPILGLGTWQLSADEAYKTIRTAIDLGYRHFDCSPMYGNQQEIGRAFSDALASGDVSREDVWITSKLWNDAHAINDVVPALRKTLSSLKVEYLDLYLVHWPVAFEPNPSAENAQIVYAPPDKYPISQTWKGMEACVDNGMAHHIGVSNFSVSKIESLIKSAIINPEMNQVELHPFLTQQSLVEYCHKNFIHVTAYGALGSRGRSPELIDSRGTDSFLDPTIRDVSMRRGMAPAQVLIKWSVERGIATLAKSSHPERLQQNFESIHFTLGVGDMESITKLNRQKRFLDASFWTGKDSPYTLQFIWDE